MVETAKLSEAPKTRSELLELTRTKLESAERALSILNQ